MPKREEMVERELRDFLYKQRDGELDSEGQFTLNAAQALKTLGRYQLATPGRWLVKVAQGGVSLGASEITFDFDKTSVAIRYYGGPPIDGRDLGRSLMSGELPSEPWKHHLVVGLRSFMAGDVRGLSWSDRAGQVTVIGEDPGQGPDPQDKGANLSLRAQLRPPRGLLGFLTPPQFRYQDLFHHLSLCHITVRVNGICISKSFPPRVSSRPAPVAIVLDYDGNTLPLVVTGPGHAHPAQSVLPVFSDLPQRVGALALLSEWPTLSSVKSYCCWVKDGAFLEPRTLKFPFQSKTHSRYGLTLYLDGNHLRTDASEFSPIAADVDLIAIQTQLRRHVNRMDLSLRGRQLGWNAEEQAKEDKRALIEAIDWIRF